MLELISLVVPIYNVEHYLSSCIESIVRQSYKNLQILLIDDGSTDSCPSICEEWVAKDSRIEVVHKANGGLSDARNAGIERAKGKYIAFVDSDDMISSDMVEYLYRLLITHNADISVCQRARINEDGNLLDDANPLFHDYAVRGNDACMHDYFSAGRIDAVAWGKLYRRELFREVRYPVGKYHEDVFTTYRLMAQASVVAVGGERKYFYRVRKASITQSVFSPKHLDAVKAKLQQAEFLAEHYPRELSYALSGIVYAANQCIWRMGISGCFSREYRRYLQAQYRAYEWRYLCYGRGKMTSKLFSLCAFVSVGMTIWIVSIVYRIRGRHNV